MRGYAKLLVAQLPNWQGEARVYEVSPPVCYYSEGGYLDYTPFLIVSAIDGFGRWGAQTYIFPAEKVGDVFDVISWCELDGSVRGAKDHLEALEREGYEVAS